MKVLTTQPFKIIYSLFKHEYLGILPESFAVQLDEENRVTFQNQNISPQNAAEFAAEADDQDFEIIDLIDSINQNAIVNRFQGRKKLTPREFFLKVFSKDGSNLETREAVEKFIEERKARILSLIQNGKALYEMGSDGDPAWRKVRVAPGRATVLFHFTRNDQNTHYFPTLSYEGKNLEFIGKHAVIINNQPAWLLINGALYSFDKEVDGKKLKPFLDKKYIEVPRKIEETYYTKFVAPLVESYDVDAKGFEINLKKYEPVPVLSISGFGNDDPSDELLSGSSTAVSNPDDHVLFELKFEYGDYTFNPDNQTPSGVTVEKTKNSYLFHKVKRTLDIEQNKVSALREFGLDLSNGRLLLGKGEAFTWLKSNQEALNNAGVRFKQKFTDKKYFIGESTIDLEVKEGNDWFDIHAVVKFGEYEIPFIELRDLILQKKREFLLPNGEFAVIPDAWFARYAELFAFMDQERFTNNITLKKHHVSLVEDLKTQNLAKLTMSRKLEKLRDFGEIEDYPLPKGFKGKLRPYQKAGYNWLHFLGQYSFGGCLADDMGLGKTVQTLAMLQYEKEQGAKNSTLLVLPTSLVYNWEMEAKKFAPDLKVFQYTGPFRDKNLEQFKGYDVVLTTYGVVRIDVEMLSDYYFNYIILDESQAIKNPKSNIAKAVKQLNSKHRLILTGTPLENSTLDLWSQMTFINPGLLGDQSFFNNEFLYPIEKKQDEDKIDKLHAIVKPFILRRSKSQVATDLPKKIENINYCPMTEEQEEEYEKTKSYFRNKILEEMGEKSTAGGTQLTLLQGLTKLRQIANHPEMIEPDYFGGSGKFELVIQMLENAMDEDHSVLVFSQFVKHLTIIRRYLDENNIKYAYLDGSSKDRAKQVEQFQTDKSIKIFLISLKAGGVGLNLTAADYVFLLDPWWNPAIEAQAMDRAHRIGQKKQVFVYKFITTGTVEEKILNLQQRKKKLAGDLISKEEGFVKSLTEDDIKQLLE